MSSVTTHAAGRVIERASEDEATPIVAVRLTAITLEGFKSFARKTSFDFEPGITGIVGPNGCGKSNIVDAFRWVLGSQSAKSLRGKEMADVIFSGGTGGKPARFAQVTLSFDNRDRYFDLDADSIDIARKLSRDGSSEYFINGQDGRLRDVKNLLLDTGIGVEAYSIIEQGKIAILLEASAAERRRIFEEAAGISKFKIKRKQTVDRMAKVEERLAQLGVILGEIEGNMRKVKSQAGKAERYQEYTSKLNELRAQRSLVQFQELVNTRETHLAEQAEARKALVLLEAQLEELRKALTDAEAEHRKALSAADELRNKRHQLEVQIAQRESTIEHQTQRQGEVAGERTRAIASIKRFEDTLGGIESRRGEAQQSLAGLGKERDGLGAAFKTLQKREAALADELSKLEDNVAARRDALFKLAHEQSAFTNELTALDGDLRHANHQIGQANRKLTEIEANLADTEAEIAEHEEQRLDIQARLTRQQAEFDGEEAAATKAEAELAELKEQSHALTIELSTLRSRIETIDRFLAGHVGLAEGARKLVDDKAERKRLGVVGVLGEAITATDAAHAQAIEGALGELANAIVIADADNAYAAMGELADAGVGGTSLLIASAFADEPVAPMTAPKGKGVVGVARGLVSATKDALAGALDPVLDTVLGQTLVVADRDAGRRLLDKLPDAAGAVTLAGELLRKPGMLRGGPEGSGLVSLCAERDGLDEKAQAVAPELERVQKQEAKVRALREKLVANLKKLRPALYDLQAKEQQAVKALDYARHQQESLGLQKATLESECSQAEGDRGRAETNRVKRQTDLDSSKGETDTSEADLEQAAESLKQARGTLTTLRETDLADARVAVAEANHRHKAFEDRLATLDEAEREAGEHLAKARADLEHADAVEAEATAAIEKAQAGLAAEREAVEQTRTDEATADEALVTCDKAIEESRAALDQASTQASDARARHQESQIRQQTALEQIETLKQRVRGELEVDLEELLRRYGAQLIDDDGNPRPPTDDDGNPIDLDATIDQLQNKVRRLGNVNMEALDELKELEQRSSGLNEQDQDLRRMLMQLRRIIDTLDTTCRNRFDETFNGIRTNFQKLFRKLFGGGRADVFLEDESDPLQSGIEIIAKPPGKEPKTLTLLSGGERSLTALALLFSIFLTKPSPFCILDEVDAALDEGNVDRFRALLNEFARRAQFLVITHAKPTMAGASRLYGVTMQEAGISKRIAIDFDQLDETRLEPAVAS